MAKIKEINILIKPIVERAEKDKDVLFAVYFSREQDAYSGNYTDGMDIG